MFSKKIAFLSLLFGIMILLGWPGPTRADYATGGDSTVDFDELFKKSLSRSGKVLNLAGKKIGDEGVRYLVNHPVMKKVTKLDLRYNEISEVGAKILAGRAGGFPRLKTLILRHNFIGDNGARAFAESKNFPNLVSLQVSWNEIRDEGGLAFARTKNFPKLKKLDLRGNYFADTTKETLKASLSWVKSLRIVESL